MIKDRSINYLSRFAQLLMSFSVVKVSSLFKVSFIVGSTWGLFSGINIAMPLVGYYGGVGLTMATALVGIMVRYYLMGSVSLHVLAYCVPGIFAGWYLTSERTWIRLMLPLVCMALFMVHPVGSQAFVYSLYWLIPVALYFVPQKPFFLNAIGSTMTAHAVGSVIWLYTMPMTAAMWWALIPLVFVERLVFASAMVIVQKVASVVITLSETLKKNKTTVSAVQ